MSAGETQLKIGVPTETFPGETRVALVPAAIKPLAKAGFELVLQKGAGFAAGFTDEEYRDAGASIVGSRDEVFAQADVIACVRAGG
ncbi:hypothetical protein OAK47_03615, partial [Planctomycetaceae bacterium]|nr:hypothetical protein [Planctomycetaceae bacterium]